ncbi:hypothetical protein DIPPA_04292 [Diplonema papillatum]|nr:hypothetical protein DIPPA_04292 [Diplonema papillatum]
MGLQLRGARRAGVAKGVADVLQRESASAPGRRAEFRRLAGRCAEECAGMSGKQRAAVLLAFRSARVADRALCGAAEAAIVADSAGAIGSKARQEETAAALAALHSLSHTFTPALLPWAIRHAPWSWPTADPTTRLSLAAIFLSLHASVQQSALRPEIPGFRPKTNPRAILDVDEPAPRDPPPTGDARLTRSQIAAIRSELVRKPALLLASAEAGEGGPADTWWTDPLAVAKTALGALGHLDACCPEGEEAATAEVRRAVGGVAAGALRRWTASRGASAPGVAKRALGTQACPAGEEAAAAEDRRDVGGVAAGAVARSADSRAATAPDVAKRALGALGHFDACSPGGEEAVAAEDKRAVSGVAADALARSADSRAATAPDVAKRALGAPEHLDACSPGGEEAAAAEDRRTHWPAPRGATTADARKLAETVAACVQLRAPLRLHLRAAPGPTELLRAAWAAACPGKPAPRPAGAKAGDGDAAPRDSPTGDARLPSSQIAAVRDESAGKPSLCASAKARDGDAAPRDPPTGNTRLPSSHITAVRGELAAKTADGDAAPRDPPTGDARLPSSQIAAARAELAANAGPADRALGAARPAFPPSRVAGEVDRVTAVYFMDALWRIHRSTHAPASAGLAAELLSAVVAQTGVASVPPHAFRMPRDDPGDEDPGAGSGEGGFGQKSDPRARAVARLLWAVGEMRGRRADAAFLLDQTAASRVGEDGAVAAAAVFCSAAARVGIAPLWAKRFAPRWCPTPELVALVSALSPQDLSCFAVRWGLPSELAQRAVNSLPPSHWGRPPQRPQPALPLPPAEKVDDVLLAELAACCRRLVDLQPPATRAPPAQPAGGVSGEPARASRLASAVDLLEQHLLRRVAAKLTKTGVPDDWTASDCARYASAVLSSLASCPPSLRRVGDGPNLKLVALLRACVRHIRKDLSPPGTARREDPGSETVAVGCRFTLASYYLWLSARVLVLVDGYGPLGREAEVLAKDLRLEGIRLATAVARRLERQGVSGAPQEYAVSLWALCSLADEIGLYPGVVAGLLEGLGALIEGEPGIQLLDHSTAFHAALALRKSGLASAALSEDLSRRFGRADGLHKNRALVNLILGELWPPPPSL